MADRVLFRFWTITDYEEEERFFKRTAPEGLEPSQIYPSGRLCF